MLLKFTTSPQILYNNMIYCSLEVQTIWELQRAGCLTITNTVSSLWEGLRKKEDTKRWCYVCHTEKLGSVQILSATVNETEAAKRKVTRNGESLNVECLVRMKRRSCLGCVKKTRMNTSPAWWGSWVWQLPDSVCGCVGGDRFYSDLRSLTQASYG